MCKSNKSQQKVTCGLFNSFMLMPSSASLLLHSSWTKESQGNAVYMMCKRFLDIHCHWSSVVEGISLALICTSIKFTTLSYTFASCTMEVIQRVWLYVLLCIPLYAFTVWKLLCRLKMEISIHKLTVYCKQGHQKERKARQLGGINRHFTYGK